MNISVIICTRNRASSLDQTLESLAGVIVPQGLNAEFLVVDNGSTDGTRELVQKRMARQSPLRYLLEPSQGQSFARNAGLDYSTGEVVIFTDDDLRFPTNWLEGMCFPIMEDKVDVVAGHVRMAPHLERKWMEQTHRSYCASSEALSPHNLDEIKGANFAFSRNVLDVVPSFDSELGPGALGFCDDTLFLAQLRQAKKRFCVSTGPPVIHHFQEDRLLRRNWLAGIKRMANSFAYVSHHWRHETMVRPRLRFCRACVKYYFWRTLKNRECSAEEGIPLWELLLLERLHRFRYWVALRDCPRKYEKFGLIKRQAN